MLVTNMKCKKDNQDPSKEQLPAITQTGANTFGFLLNGEVWLPKGGLLSSILDLTYDPNYKNGSFGIFANRYLPNEDKVKLTIGLTNVNKAGRYELNYENKNIIYSDSKSPNCYYYEDISITGFVDITKIDLVNKFISGTFEFKLEKSGCPAINATQGRFDLKIE
jgi:hypothetical protein